MRSLRHARHAPSAGPAEMATAGVVARPPRLYLGVLGAGLALDWLRPLGWPRATLPAGVRVLAGLALVGLGVGLMGAAMRRFRAAGTPIETWRPTRALVTDGPFRLSRNPIYVALTLLYLGLAVAAGSAWSLVLLGPLLVVVDRGVIRREERYLEARFGDAYRRYRASVRRWL